MVDAINSLAARLDRNDTPSRVREYLPPFQILPYIENGDDDRILVSPGCIMAIDPQETDTTLAIRNLAGILFTGTGNSGFNISPMATIENGTVLMNQIQLGGTNIKGEDNGYYLAVQVDFTLGSSNHVDGYMGSNAQWVTLEVPTNIQLKLIPCDDWLATDNVTSNGTTRYIGPLGFCQYVDNASPNIINYWKSDIIIPLYYRDSDTEEPVIVSADGGNEITAGSDGGAFYEAPTPP